MTHQELLEQAISAWQEGRPLEPHIDEMIEAGHPFAPVFSRIHTPPSYPSTNIFDRETHDLLKSPIHKTTGVMLGYALHNNETHPAIKMVHTINDVSARRLTIPLRKTEWTAIHNYLRPEDKGDGDEPLSTHEAEPPVHMSREGHLTLHHFSPYLNDDEVTVDPDEGEKNRQRYSRAEFRESSVRRNFWYLNPDEKEGQIYGTHYVAEVPEEKVYDLHKDHEGHTRSAEGKGISWLFNKLIESGYHGAKYNTGGRDIVTTFVPIKAKRVQPEQLSREFSSPIDWAKNGKTMLSDFTTSNGKSYTVHAQESHHRPGVHTISFAINDHPGGAFKATGTGSAKEVFSHVIAHVHSLIHDHGAKRIEFAADHKEPSRVKFYAWLAARAHKLHPDFKGVVQHDPRQYVKESTFYLAHKDVVPKLLQDLKENIGGSTKDGVEIEQLARPGENFDKFFSDVSSGKGVYQPKQPYKPILDPAPHQEFADARQKFLGHFDQHIQTSIPTFGDIQDRKGQALAHTFGKSGGHLLDIGGSEGSFAKALSHVTGGKVRSTVLDPNPEMKAHFDKSPVTGSHYLPEGFPHHDGRKYDIVHEAMTFQFLHPDRAEQLSHVKKALKDDGLFLSEQKFHTDDWAKNEELKDREHKNLYYDSGALDAKNKVVSYNQQSGGMMDNLVHHKEYEKLLKSHFAHVAQYWDAGNFKGYAASNDRKKLDTFVKHMGNVQSKFSNVDTPMQLARKVEWVKARGQHFGQFETSNGQNYTFSSTESPPGHHGVAFAINDHLGIDPFAATGTGAAKEVFGHVIAHIHSLIHDHGAKSIHFTASHSEPSRVKLYDFLAKKIHKIHPDFKALVTRRAVPQGMGERESSYTLLHKDEVDAYKEKLKGGGLPEPEQLAKWEESFPGRHYSAFETPGGNYVADAYSSENGRHEISFENLDRPDDMTGILHTGHAKAVMENMIALTHDYLHTHTPGIVSFTGAEPSRRKLYKWLAARVHKIHPDYTGHVEEDPDDTHPLSYAEFHLVHKDYPKPKGAVQLAKWEPPFEGSTNLRAHFETPGGQYAANLKALHGPQNRIGKEPMRKLAFGMIDPEHGAQHFGQTGVGHGKATFGHMIELVHDLLHRDQPPVVTFTSDAEEPTREKLYKSLVSKVHKVHPHYTGHMVIHDKYARFFLVHRDHLPEFTEKIGGAREGVRQLAREWEPSEDEDDYMNARRAKFTASGKDYVASAGPDEDGEHYFHVPNAPTEHDPEFLKESARLLIKHIDDHDTAGRINLWGLGIHAKPLAQVVRRMRPRYEAFEDRTNETRPQFHLDDNSFEDVGLAARRRNVHRLPKNPNDRTIKEADENIGQALGMLNTGGIIAPAVDRMEEEGKTDHPLFPILKRLHDGKGLENRPMRGGSYGMGSFQIHHSQGVTHIGLEHFKHDGKWIPGARLHSQNGTEVKRHLVPLRKHEFSKLSDYLHGVEQDPHGTEEPHPEQLSAVSDSTSAQGDERKKLLLRLLLEAKLKPIAAGNSYALHPAGMNAGQYAEVYHNGEPEAVDYVGHYYGLLSGQASLDLHAFHEGDGNHTLTVFDSPLPTDHLYEALGPAVGSPMVRVLPKDGFNRVAVVNLPGDSGILKTANATNVQQFNGNFATLRHRSSPGASPAARETHRNAIRNYERQQGGNAEPQG